MAEQLAFDFIVPEQPFSASLDNFFFVGYEPEMVPTNALKRNVRSMKSFGKIHKAQLFLPLRAKPFAAHQYFTTKSRRGVVNTFDNPEAQVGTSISYLLSALFWIGNKEHPFEQELFIPRERQHTTLIESVLVDCDKKNKISVTAFISTRDLTPKITARVRGDSNKAPSLDLRRSKVLSKLIVHMVYELRDNRLFLTEDSELRTCVNGEVKTYPLAEKAPGTGLPLLYNFFHLEKMKWFFSSSSIAPQTQKVYINAVGELIMGALCRLYPAAIKAGFMAGYFEGLIFTQTMGGYLFKDLFNNIEVLRPVFVNGLKDVGEITPFKNPFRDMTFMDLMKYPVGPTSTVLNDYFPMSKWSIKKTAEFWRLQSQFFVEDGYLALPTFKSLVHVLQQVHLFYCIYHKLFSDQLDKVDEIYNSYYLRYIVYDYDLVHFTETRSRDELQINIRNQYSAYIIEAFYNHAPLVSDLVSNTKMRRIFQDFFRPYNMFGGGNEYSTPDGHIYATLLCHYNYIAVFPQQWKNLTTLTQTKDRYREDIDWKHMTSLKDIHARIAQYTRRFKYPGNPRTNPIYDVFTKADLKIPNTNYELVFAEDTGEIRLWGEEQNHCIADYAEYLNDTNYLMFGVRETSSGKWWGHCMMTLTDQGRGASKQKYYEELPPFWREDQFRGYQNKSLDADMKRRVVEHMLRFIYPAKPEQKTEKGLEVGDYNIVVTTPNDELQHV